MLKPELGNWGRLRPQKGSMAEGGRGRRIPFQCKKNTAPPLSLFPSSFGRILPEGKIFLLTEAEGPREERPFKVRFRRLARMER